MKVKIAKFSVLFLILVGVIMLTQKKFSISDEERYKIRFLQIVEYLKFNISSYGSMFGEYPDGSQMGIFGGLTGDNPRQIDFVRYTHLDDLISLDQNGSFVSKPLGDIRLYFTIHENHLVVFSPGKDGIFSTFNKPSKDDLFAVRALPPIADERLTARDGGQDDEGSLDVTTRVPGAAVFIPENPEGLRLAPAVEPLEAVIREMELPSSKHVFLELEFKTERAIRITLPRLQAKVLVDENGHNVIFVSNDLSPSHSTSDLIIYPFKGVAHCRVGIELDHEIDIENAVISEIVVAVSQQLPDSGGFSSRQTIRLIP